MIYENSYCLKYIKLCLVVRLLFWRFWKCEVTYSLPLFAGPLWPRVVIPVRVPSRGQIILSKNQC